MLNPTSEAGADTGAEAMPMPNEFVDDTTMFSVLNIDCLVLVETAITP